MFIKKDHWSFLVLGKGKSTLTILIIIILCTIILFISIIYETSTNDTDRCASVSMKFCIYLRFYGNLIYCRQITNSSHKWFWPMRIGLHLAWSVLTNMSCQSWELYIVNNNKYTYLNKSYQFFSWPWKKKDQWSFLMNTVLMPFILFIYLLLIIISILV